MVFEKNNAIFFEFLKCFRFCEILEFVFGCGEIIQEIGIPGTMLTGKNHFL